MGQCPIPHRGIHGLNGCGIYDLNGWGIYALKGWGIYTLNGWGSYGKVGYCFWEMCLKKHWSSGETTLSGHHMTTGLQNTHVVEFSTSIQFFFTLRFIG